jgi:hypothetical protein
LAKQFDRRLSPTVSGKRRFHPFGSPKTLAVFSLHNDARYRRTTLNDRGHDGFPQGLIAW